MLLYAKTAQHFFVVMREVVETSRCMQISLDEKSFSTLLLAPGVHVIDFTAAWCGPCRTMVPILAALEREYVGRVSFAAVDVDHEPQLAQRYDVRSMPTLVFVRDGREVARIVGARSRAFVTDVLDRALG
jgi:thioredoxin 1